MAGELYSCSRWHPMFEVARGQPACLDFFRGGVLNSKQPLAWQIFRFTANIGHRLCFPNFFLQLVPL